MSIIGECLITCGNQANDVFGFEYLQRLQTEMPIQQNEAIFQIPISGHDRRLNDPDVLN